MLTLDDLLRFLGATALNPYLAPMLPLLLVFSGAEPSPVHLDAETSDLILAHPVSLTLILALSYVAFVWMLSLNRLLNLEALNNFCGNKAEWKRELVVVTGGAQGVGGELVRKLEAQGAIVAVLDIKPLTYEAGCNVHYFECDVSSLAAVSEAREAIIATCGREPTMLVANASVVRGKTILRASERDIRITFDVNLLGVIWGVKTFLPDMIAARRGHVLVTSSATAFLTAASVADYSASKAAVASFIEGLQTEVKCKYGNPGVAISAIFSATIATNMFKGIKEGNKFFMPVLSPEQVARRMMKVLQEGQSNMVMMPALVYILPWLRVLPHWVRIAAQDRVAHIMDNLTIQHYET